MHIFHKPQYRSTSEWIYDLKLLYTAYSEMKSDKLCDTEINQIKFKYLRKHLTALIGEEDADRIIREHGL